MKRVGGIGELFQDTQTLGPLFFEEHPAPPHRVGLALGAIPAVGIRQGHRDRSQALETATVMRVLLDPSAWP